MRDFKLPPSCRWYLRFFLWRAPQQMLRRHRSLEAYCATLWWRWFAFSIFPSNGSPVEWNWQGKTEVLGEENCPSVTLFTTNPTWTNPGLRGERPATNRLSHDTAFWDITQRSGNSIPTFRTTYRSHLQRSRSPKIKVSSWTSWPLNIFLLGLLDLWRWDR
jgi:hypothetical protein